MGVKDLWTILAPVREECSLASLAGKRLAVDISGWVCQSCTVKSLSRAVEKPHLRTLFFRVHTLYCLGVSLVFVIDGEAVQLKWEEMDKREGRSGVISVKGCEGRKTGQRTRLNCKIKECCELLDLLGVPHLQSRGEAEALCALLNSQGVVDGVLTQDSDAFLYGATVVYRDLTTNEKDPRVDCYRMEAIRETLALTRHDLVALSLLLGCDYCPQGVPGVGKEKALKLISSCRTSDPTCDLLQRFRVWRDGEDHTPSTIEKQIQRKALTVPGFPNEKVISEYLIPKDRVATDVTTTLQWKMPQITGVQSFCARHLGWLLEYAHTKTLPLLTQWVMREGMQHDKKSLKPESILRQRVRHGAPFYEVQWEEDGGSTVAQIDEGQGGGASTDATKGQRSHNDWITLEHAEQFEAVFPELCAVFKEQREQAKRKKGPKKLKKTTSEVQENSEPVPHPVTSIGSNSDKSESEHDSEDDLPLLTRLGGKKVAAASQSRVAAKHPCAGIDTQTKGRVPASHPCANVDPPILKAGKSPDEDVTSFFRVTKPKRDGKTSTQSPATEGTQQTEDTSTSSVGTKDSVSDTLTSGGTKDSVSDTLIVDKPKPPIKTTHDTSNVTQCLDSSDEDDLPLFTRLKQKTTRTERKSEKGTAKPSATRKGTSAATPIVID